MYQPLMRMALNPDPDVRVMEELTVKSLAVSRASHGEFQKALEAFEQLKRKRIERYGPDYSGSEMNQINFQIGVILFMRGEYDESLKVLTELLGVMEQCRPDYEFQIFETKCYLAPIYARRKNKEKVDMLYAEMRDYLVPLSDREPLIVELKRNMAMSLRHSGCLEGALAVFKEIYEIRRSTYGEAAIITEYSHADVAVVLLEMGKFNEALRILERVHGTFRLGAMDEIYYLRLKRYLAEAHMHLRLPKIAEDLFKLMNNTIGYKNQTNPEVIEAKHNWGRSLVMVKKAKRALEVLNEAYAVRCEQTPKHLDTARMALDIANIHLNSKEYSDAAIAFLDIPARISKTFKWSPDLLHHYMDCVASILRSFDNTDLDEQLLQTYDYVYRKQLEMRGESNVHGDNLGTRNLIGEALLRKKPGEALQIFQEVLEKRTLVLKNDYMDCVDVLKNIARAHRCLNDRVKAFEYCSEVYEIQKCLTGDNSLEAVHWEGEIRVIAPEAAQKSVLVDTVVSNYRTSLKGGADSESVNMEENNFPLHVASETGRIAMIKFLLQKGAVYNEENPEGKTPADIACNNAVKNLFRIVDDLFLAVKKMDREGMDRIFSVMNDTRLREDTNRGFPMLLTGFDQIRDVIDKTLLNARDGARSTPLHLACGNGDAKTVKILLDLEADRTLLDINNQTPRDVAEGKSFVEILGLLDRCVDNKANDLEDSTITQKNPEMPEDIMDT